jgi:hypothetical protein
MNVYQSKPGVLRAHNDCSVAMRLVFLRDWYKFPTMTMLTELISNRFLAEIHHLRWTRRFLEVAQYLNDEMTNLNGFEIFDHTNHYEIVLPPGWKQPSPIPVRNGQLGNASNLVSPLSYYGSARTECARRVMHN